MALTIKPIVGTVKLFGNSTNKPTIGLGASKKPSKFTTQKPKPDKKQLGIFNNNPAPKIDVEAAKERAMVVNDPLFIKGYINGIYFARVMLFEIIFMARDGYSPKQIETKNRELVEHLDLMIDEMREKLGLIAPEVSTEHFKTNTLEEAYENRNQKGK